MNTWRPGRMSPLIAPYTSTPGRRPITWSMYCKCRAVVLMVPQIRPSASPFFNSIAAISVVRRRISSFAYCAVTPLRA